MRKEPLADQAALASSREVGAPVGYGSDGMGGAPPTLLMDSSSCPVVSWQYLHVLMAVHTICCCARSRLQLGAIDTSDGWPTAFSCSCTFLAYARRCFAHTRCKSRSTTSICSAVPRLNDRLRLRKSSLEELKTRESGRPLVGASHRSSPSSCPNASPMFLSSSET
eukprot:scaffold221517_cov27-Tisochrysis_lutea.AAC.2